MHIEKRNGEIVTFDGNKIVNAINKAFSEVDGKVYESDTATDIAIEIGKKIDNSKTRVTVEEIQNWVEEYLMASERKDVARAYVRYRYRKEVARGGKDDFFSAIGEKLNGIGIENSNANMDENSFSGRIGTASDLMLKKYALNYCMSKMSRENHLNNEIYIHDISHYPVGTHNCLSIPFDDLLSKGFKVRQIDIRPANSVNTAMQLVAVIFQLQSLQQFGGVSATHIDWTMVPYVRKSFMKHYADGLKYLYDETLDEEMKNTLGKASIADTFLYDKQKAYKYAMDMTEKEIHQSSEALFHNLNSLQSRSGGQLPFTSLNFGTCTLQEGRMITKALLEVSIEGVGKFHKTSIFPCSIFQLKKGINRKPGDPNYDLFQLALKSTSQRLYPNYANCDWNNNAGYDPNNPSTYFSTMGRCKL